MLNIYYGDMLESVYNTVAYFKYDYEDSWILDPFVKEMIQDGDFEKLIWVPIDESSQYNIKPSFLKEKIREIIEGTSLLHIVTDQDREKKWMRFCRNCDKIAEDMIFLQRSKRQC